MDHGHKRQYCQQCKKNYYRNPTIGVAIIMLQNDELLLVKRSGSYNGMWCIPCGHVEWGEDIRLAACREFKEETGLEIAVGPVFAVHSNFHDMEKQTVGVWFWAKKIGGTLRPGSDASDVKFFPLDAIPKKMAFPTDLLVCDQLRSCLKSGYLSRWLNSCVAREWTTLDM